MKRLFQLAPFVLLNIGLQPRPSAAVPVADQLVGTWNLVSYVDTPEGKAPIYAFGTKPIGQFIFTTDGHVSLGLMRNPPDITAPTTDPDPEACIPGWYCSYFGTYTVDSQRGVWVTHVIGGNIPSYVNTDQPRTFAIHGNTLVISETSGEGSERVHSERVFVRAAKAGS